MTTSSITSPTGGGDDLDLLVLIGQTRRTTITRPPTVWDDFADLLTQLTEARRRGFIAQLAVGYYEGWRPDREEVATLIALELGHPVTTHQRDHLARRRRNAILRFSEPGPHFTMGI